MKIAFLLYPTERLKVNEETSFWMMFELQKRGHTVFAFEDKGLFWAPNAPFAHLTPMKLDPKKGYLPSKPRNPEPVSLLDLDAIVIRKEPPFDERYLHALQLLALVRESVFILNDPNGIIAANEKLFILEFPKFIPETLVTEHPDAARAFMKNLKSRVVVKPLDQKGGRGIFSSSFSDRNFPSLFETITDSGRRKVMLQRFVSADRHGDKRILILNGEALGAFIRKPPAHDFRANLSVGASMHASRLSKRDHGLINAMREKLSAGGLYLVGIDVIGNYLTEVNVTSPAGIPEINALSGTHPERSVADFIESRRRFLK
ncbi:MAG: glutathione synthase [Candidatus Omnitrophica bacterium]|nr:glutathione synthase [Candidatus Omnitrophota bacterium]